MNWNIGTGVVAVLAVLALLVVTAMRRRHAPGVRDARRGSDGAQVWMTSDTGPRRGDSDAPARGREAAGGDDAGGGGSADSAGGGGEGGSGASGNGGGGGSGGGGNN